jgi:hypothetical protein
VDHSSAGAATNITSILTKAGEAPNDLDQHELIVHLKQLRPLVHRELIRTSDVTKDLPAAERIKWVEANAVEQLSWTHQQAVAYTNWAKGQQKGNTHGPLCGKSDNLKIICETFVRSIMDQDISTNNATWTRLDFKTRVQQVSYNKAQARKPSSTNPVLLEMGLEGMQVQAGLAFRLGTKECKSKLSQKNLSADRTKHDQLWSAQLKADATTAIQNFRDFSTPVARQKRTAQQTACKSQQRAQAAAAAGAAAPVEIGEMKVVELKAELKTRGISGVGKKELLVAGLKAAMEGTQTEAVEAIEAVEAVEARENRGRKRKRDDVEKSKEESNDNWFWRGLTYFGKAVGLVSDSAIGRGAVPGRRT